MRDVSAVVCTHRLERWPLLLECLASLRRQTLLPMEVIVVVDGCPDIISRLEARGGPELTLATPYPSGLSCAKNLGIAQASGRFVAFLDDDAVADDSWLQVLRGVLEDETVAGVGGVSLPNWEGHHPDWMPDELLWTLGCSYLGMPRTQSDVRNVYGGSACFRKDIFARYGGFNPDLGRKATNLAGCEETELCLRVRSRSESLRFVHEPAAAIHHHVSRSRQSIRYMLSRCMGEGRSKAIVRAMTDDGRSRPLTDEANYLAHVVPRGILGNLGQFFRGDPWGLARAALLAAGVVNTVAAYEMTRMRRAFRRSGRRGLSRSPEVAPAAARRPGPDQPHSTATANRSGPDQPHSTATASRSGATCQAHSAVTASRSDRAEG